MHYKICEICGIRSGRVIDKKRTFMAKFPLDENRCKKWVQVTGKEDLAYIPIEKLHHLKYICGNHFKPTDFKKKKTQLRKTAVPSLLISLEPLRDEILVGFPLHIFTDNKPLSSNMVSKSSCQYTKPLIMTSEINVDTFETSKIETPSSHNIMLAVLEYTIIIMECDYCIHYIESQKQSPLAPKIMIKNRKYSPSKKKKRKVETKTTVTGI